MSTTQTAAEKAIQVAADHVEEAGASRHLTDAVILLGEARQKVADHAAGKPEMERPYLADPTADGMRAHVHKVFTYRPPLPGQRERHEALTERIVDLASFATEVCPPSAELVLAFRALEEFRFRCNQAIQVNERAPTDPVPATGGYHPAPSVVTPA